MLMFKVKLIRVSKILGLNSTIFLSNLNSNELGLRRYEENRKQDLLCRFPYLHFTAGMYNSEPLSVFKKESQENVQYHKTVSKFHLIINISYVLYWYDLSLVIVRIKEESLPTKSLLRFFFHFI
jgi:hypothetical protein